MSFNSVRSVALVITIKGRYRNIIYYLVYLSLCEGNCCLGIDRNVSGQCILMKGHQSEATDYTNSTMPIDNTTILIEEEKEQEETNVTDPSGIKSGL